jgi:NAD-dependent DNA ligase
MRRLLGCVARRSAGSSSNRGRARLQKQLAEYADAYYNDGRALVTDAEYDALQLQLGDERVGREPSAGRDTAPHSSPMLSLHSVRSLAQLGTAPQRVWRPLLSMHLTDPFNSTTFSSQRSSRACW